MEFTCVGTLCRRPAEPETDKLSDARKPAFVILILACVIRLIAAGLWSDIDATHVDPSEYIALGQNIRLHSTFSFGSPHPWGADGRLNSPGPFVPTAARAPLYPLVIAGLWWREEPPVLEIRVLQVLLGGLIALLVYCMALPVFGRQCALLAGLAMALAPESVHMTSTCYERNSVHFSPDDWTVALGPTAGLACRHPARSSYADPCRFVAVRHRACGHGGSSQVQSRASHEDRARRNVGHPPLDHPKRRYPACFDPRGRARVGF